MDTRKFLLSMNEIDDKYIKEADIFGPVQPVKLSPVLPLLRWAGGLAACLVLVGGLWFLGRNGLLPFAETDPQPGGASSLSNAVSGTEVLSEGTVTMNQDGSLTFSNPEFQEIQRVFLRHEPVVTGEDVQAFLSDTENGSVDRILTLTLPLFVADRYTAMDRTNLLCQLLETDYYFCKPKDGSPAYLKSVPRFGGLAGVIGYYDENYTYHAEQPRYAEKDNYADLLQEFGGTEPKGRTAQNVSGESADLSPGSPRDLEGPYEKWERYGGDSLIYKLIYSYLEQNDLLEYARVLLPGATEFIELVASDSEAQTSEPLIQDAVSISSTGLLTFVDAEYQKLYSAFQENSWNVKADDDAVSEAADDSCTMVLNISLPYYVIGRYPAEEGTTHLLCLLCETQYGFFEKNDEKVIKPIGGYSDLAGMIAVQDSGTAFALQRGSAWYPSDGSLYLSSIAEFTGLTEEAASALVERADRERSVINKEGKLKLEALSQQLLFAYMFQNDMTGYRLWDGNTYRPVSEAELMEAAQLNMVADHTNKAKQAEDDQIQAAAQAASKEEIRTAAKDAAQDYVNQWLSDTEHPLAECFYQNLKVSAVSDEKPYFRISLRMVFQAENEESLSYWMAGNTKEGTGENEGYYTAGRTVEVEKVDSVWTITDQGTGGFPTGTDGIRAVDWSIE